MGKTAKTPEMMKSMSRLGLAQPDLEQQNNSPVLILTWQPSLVQYEGQQKNKSKSLNGYIANLRQKSKQETLNSSKDSISRISLGMTIV